MRPQPPARHRGGRAKPRARDQSPSTTHSDELLPDGGHDVLVCLGDDPGLAKSRLQSLRARRNPRVPLTEDEWARISMPDYARLLHGCVGPGDASEDRVGAEGGREDVKRVYAVLEGKHRRLPSETVADECDGPTGVVGLHAKKDQVDGFPPAWRIRDIDSNGEGIRIERVNSQPVLLQCTQLRSARDEKNIVPGARQVSPEEAPESTSSDDDDVHGILAPRLLEHPPNHQQLVRRTEHVPVSPMLCQAITPGIFLPIPTRSTTPEPFGPISVTPGPRMASCSCTAAGWNGRERFWMTEERLDNSEESAPHSVSMRPRNSLSQTSAPRADSNHSGAWTGAPRSASATRSFALPVISPLDPLPR